MSATVIGDAGELASALVNAALASVDAATTTPARHVLALTDATDPRAATALAASAPDDTVIVNADDDALLALAAASAAAVRTVGMSMSAATRASAVEVSTAGTTFTATLDGVERAIRLRVIGEHFVVPALIAIEAAVLAGVDAATATDRLERVSSVGHARMELSRPADGIVVLNDAAEATFASTAAALKTLALITRESGRSVAVLGELSTEPDDYRDDHDRIGRLVVRLNVKKLVVVGHGARHINTAAGLEGSWDGESVLVDTLEEAYDLVSADLRDGDVVLVKSSAAAGLRILGDRLGGVSA